MSLDLAQMDKLVDQYWRDSIQETAEFGDGFWQRCQSTEVKSINKKGEKWKVRTLYNESESGADFDGDTLASGGNSGFQNLYVPYRTMSTTGLITQAAIDNDDGKSKYHPLVGEMNSTKLLAAKKLNRHLLMGDGTGRIAELTAEESGSTVTCAPTTVFGNKGVQFVPPGKKVQIYDPTGVTQRGTGKLTVSTSTIPVKTTGVITFTSAVDASATTGDIVVPEGMGARGVHGLPYWVANSGSLFELARATYPGLKSTMVDGSSGSLMVLIESLFSQMMHYVGEEAIEGKSGGGYEIFWSPTQREKYRKEAIGTGIAMLGESKVESGFGQKETLLNYTCTTIKDHDNTKVHVLRMSDWYRVGNNAAAPFEPYKVNGQSLYHLNNTDGEATTGLAFTLRGYVNLACRNVRAQAAIYSLPTSGLATGNV